MFQQTHLNNKLAYHTYPFNSASSLPKCLNVGVNAAKKNPSFNLRTCGEYGMYALEPPLTTEA